MAKWKRWQISLDILTREVLPLFVLQRALEKRMYLVKVGFVWIGTRNKEEEELKWELQNVGNRHVWGWELAYQIQGNLLWKRQYKRKVCKHFVTTHSSSVYAPNLKLDVLIINFCGSLIRKTPSLIHFINSIYSKYMQSKHKYQNKIMMIKDKTSLVYIILKPK